jgi:hypothetical protein
MFYVVDMGLSSIILDLSGLPGGNLLFLYVVCFHDIQSLAC